MPNHEVEDLFTVVSLLDQELRAEAEKKAEAKNKKPKKKGAG